jgi:hypothetical protein
MWDQLSPGSKRFMAWLGLLVGAIMLVLAVVYAFMAEWWYVGMFAIIGVAGLVQGRSQLRSIHDPHP